MNTNKVSLLHCDQPLAPVRQALELCGGLERIGAQTRVVLKPNVVFWTAAVAFPKWGVVTTSRLVHDMVRLLTEHGVGDITIVEGVVNSRRKDHATTAHAFETLGYNRLAKRYGVRVLDAFLRPYQEIDLGEGMKLSFNLDALQADLVITLPVMKTHAQTVVSLGLKNLKGLIDVNSRKRCHSADPDKDLHYWVSRLAEPLPPVLAVIDGTYTSEYGPGFESVAHRSNLLAASWDLLSADKVGAALLGYSPEQVPHLAHALRKAGRPLDLSDVDLQGESLQENARLHRWSFPYTEDGLLPAFMAKKGVRGLSYHKYDTTLCTYCSAINGLVLSSIMEAWQGDSFDEVEVLTGKLMKPRPEARKTILLGRCMYQAHKDNPDIREMIAVRGCPPQPEQIVKALHQAGIMVDPALFAHMDRAPGMYLKRYQGRPEFDESLFRVL